VKIAYIGGGSTRAPGTVAAFVQRGEHFAGSEITLFDRRPQRAWEARSGAEILLEAAIAAVRAAGQSPNRVAPRWEPAVGAVVIGLQAAGVVGRDAVAQRLDVTAPDGLIFDVHAPDPP
jgi:hypothetical protein